jgi:hypothetical protein
MQRREVEPEQQPHPDYRPYERPRRSAADFPAALVPTHWWSKMSWHGAKAKLGRQSAL